MGIRATHVGKTIGKPPNRVLTDINLDIQDGEFVALTGRSGSGKSTLLYILSSLDNPTEGKIEISGNDIQSMESEDLHRFRNLKMGFVFQFHYLIDELTTLQNVLMPTLKFQREKELSPYAEFLLDQFGLKEKLHRYPRQLSGGEQQRVAIARALIMRPQFLFADEPTGSLDTANSDVVMGILQEVNKKNNTTVLMVTHDPDFASMAPRQIRLKDGRMVEE
ncbi:MAG: ABC transporter ATP-binding protein [Bdellovibrionales bacterium]|nr:ABC transporter ATP-binding protein [Bdellovibrionales bacterium]